MGNITWVTPGVKAFLVADYNQLINISIPHYAVSYIREQPFVVVESTREDDEDDPVVMLTNGWEVYASMLRPFRVAKTRRWSS